MASCSQWFYAEDQDGNYPSAVDPMFVLKNYSTGAIIGDYTIPSTGRQLTLDSSIRYKAIPILDTSDVDWIRPSDVIFYGCAKDLTFVWKRKICTPGAKKCVGNDVYTCNSDGTEWRYTKNCPGGCSGGECIGVPVANGFTINVATGLATKTLLVAHVVKMPFIGLVGPDPNLWYWPQAFDYVGGKWFLADPATKYRVEVGSIFETIPSFDKTYGTGSFADGIHCVVLAEGEGGVGSLIFKGEDVFQLFKDSPTEIYLSSTSTDVLTEAVMGPVCDFFGIPRGPQCSSFWAEFSDPVFIANYVSILRTGKDTLGNSRELSVFDHLALPFAIIGVVAPQVPFGKFISKGLEGLWMGGRVFTDAAFNWMKTVTINVPPSMHLDKSTLTFMEAIVKLNPDTHIDEVMSMIADGHYDDALSRIHQYLPGDFGSVDWWKYQKFNDALKNYLPPAQFDQLMGMIHGFGPQADTIIGVVKQTYLSADDLAKIASASKYPQIMDEATLAIYRSIRDLDVASATKIDELRNILKNSPEISNRLIASYKSILDKVASGQRVITREEIKTIFHHADLAPDDIVELVKTSDNLALIVSKLTDGAYSQALGNFLDSTKKYWDYVNTQVGKTEADTFLRNNAKIARKALDTNDPAKMADIPHAGQEYAAKHSDVIDDFCVGQPASCIDGTSDDIFGDGRTVADELTDLADEFATTEANGWRETGKAYAKNVDDSRWGWFSRLSDVNQERAIHGMMGATLVFALAVLVKIYTDAGPQSLNLKIYTQNLERFYWPCFHACRDKDADTLDAAIKIYEAEIIRCEASLNEYKTVLESDGTYTQFLHVLQLHQFSLAHFKNCLAGLMPTGTIKCTSNEDFFYVDLDGQPAGFSYANREVLLTAIKTGPHTVKIHKHLFTPECTESVNVVEGVPKTVDCQMTETGVCSEVTAVSIYIDPLSPIKDETVSFNGSAKSDDPITTWEWNFGDGFTATGQAVTHSYKSANVYKVELKVINDCGKYATAMRNVTVSEEAPPAESTTLTIERMIYESGVDIPRYWEVEIWVDGKYTECQGPQTLIFGTGVYCDCAAPWNLVPCELGQHTITLKKYGYDDVSISVYLEKDKPKTWESPVMVKSVAPPTQRTISFSVPVGSTVYVGGKPLTGTTVLGRLSMILNDLRK